LLVLELLILQNGSCNLCCKYHQLCTGSVEKGFWNVVWEVFRILLHCMCYIFYSNSYIYMTISLLLWK